MFINIEMLLMWWIIGFIIALVSAILGKDTMFEFIARFAFIAFFNTVVFLILSYFQIIK